MHLKKPFLETNLRLLNFTQETSKPTHIPVIIWDIFDIFHFRLIYLGHVTRLFAASSHIHIFRSKSIYVSNIWCISVILVAGKHVYIKKFKSRNYLLNFWNLLPFFSTPRLIIIMSNNEFSYIQIAFIKYSLGNHYSWLSLFTAFRYLLFLSSLFIVFQMLSHVTLQ